MTKPNPTKLEAYLRYSKYLIRHIWFVRKACWSKGLFLQGIFHDLSKWRPDEFIPYANFFYGEKSSPRDSKTGYYKPQDTGDLAFEMAWMNHIHRNPHHWQHWVLLNDDGTMTHLPMPRRYALEMLCDWWGASMAQGYNGRCRTWYDANKYKIQLHPRTREWVEKNVSDDWLK